MRRLQKFLFNLSASDRLLLIKTVLLLAAIRLGLLLLPLQTLRRVLAKLTPTTTNLRQIDPASASKISWSVIVASQCIPGAKCLAQSLTTQVLLLRCGYPTDLRIGIVRDKGGLSAHAWLESFGQVVFGGEGNMHLYISVPLEEVDSNVTGLIPFA